MSQGIKSEPVDVDEPEYILDFDVEEPQEAVLAPSSTKKDSVCSHCKLVVRNDAELSLHIKAFHGTEVPARNNFSLVLDVDEEENVDDPGYILSASANYSSAPPATSTNFSNSNNNFYCSKCYFASNNQQVIQDHMMKNKHIEQFICNYCDKYFPFKHSLTKHHEICNKNNALCYTQYEPSAMKEGSKYVCAKCLYLTDSEVDINKHHFVAHKETSTPPTYFIQLSAALGRPEVNLHNSNTAIICDKDEKIPKIPLVASNAPMFFICTDCKMAFDKHTLFVEHRSTAHKDKNIIKFIASRSKVGPWKQDDNFQRFCCLYCGTVYFELVSLKAHFRVHKQFKIPFQYIFLTPKKGPKLMEEDTYKCTLCEAYPDGLKEIQMHWKKEHGNKIFKVIKLYSGNPFENYFCKLCDSKFCHQMMLEYHNMAKHSDEEGFKQGDIIPVLDKSNSGNLLLSPLSKLYDKNALPKSKPPNHIGGKIADLYLRHVSKRYQCMFCLFSTDNFTDLKYHHQKKHSEFIWQYIYVRKSNAGSLKMISSTEKMYKCYYCDFDFDKKIDEKSTQHFTDNKHEQVRFKSFSGLDGYASWKEDDIISCLTDTVDVKPDINLLKKNLLQSGNKAGESDAEKITPDNDDDFEEEILPAPILDDIEILPEERFIQPILTEPTRKRKKVYYENIENVTIYHFDGQKWDYVPYKKYAKMYDIQPEIHLRGEPAIKNNGLEEIFN